MINPGGLGESVIVFLSRAAKITQKITGGDFDMVAWVPRRLGQSTPSANYSAQGAPGLSTFHQLTARGDVSSAIGATFLEGVYTDAKATGETCKTSIGGPTDAGPHITTKIVVEDMVSILDAYAASPEGKLVENA